MTSHRKKPDFASCMQWLVEELYAESDLRNLADGRRYAVRERKATYEVRPGGCLSGRIFPFEGAYLLSGVMDLWPDEAADWLKREFRKLTRNKGGTPIRPPDVERYVHRSSKSVDDADDVEDLD